MKLLFKQRFFSWFDSYDIYNEAGETVYTVEGKLSWGHCLHILDAAGNHIGTVKERVLTLLPKFELYENDEYIGSIQKAFTFFAPKFDIDCNGWQVQGSFMEWDYQVTEPCGALVATVTKELFHWTDTYIKIVEPDTDREVPYGQEGEILLAGPTVMKEYMNNPEETAQTLRTHADGLTWVYTGDLGVMDEQGFIYFRGRAKRMIISSGYNVYPGQIENILDAHEYVQMSCVIGVPDPYKMQKVKAFVKLAQGVPATEETKQVLMAYCRKNVAKYAMPYDIEFKEDMPKTLVGKVAYRQLEEEELAKIKAAEEK